jgi:serine/threonine protein kinase
VSGGAIGGRFVVEAEVASGGMGRVLRARDRDTDQLVAVKTMLRGDPAALARFERECRALSEIGHPGIVGYVGHGVQADGSPYLAMQWLTGRDLAQVLRDLRAPTVAAGRSSIHGTGLTVRDTITLGVRMASALGALHRAGIVHRDVKPSNVFLPDGTVDNAKLVDLGTVRTSGTQRDLTQTGAVVGTPYYMSPEQARGDEDITPASDVFALGCVLYECLTGVCPFYASHFVAVLGRILLDEPQPIPTLRAEIPPALVALITLMLRKTAAERPADGDATAARLTEVRESISGIQAIETMSALGDLRAQPEAHSSVGSDERRLSCFLWARASGSIDPAIAREHAASVTDLGDGSLLLGIAGVASPAEQAVRTVRLALAIRQAVPHAALSIATGQIDAPAGRAPTGSDVARRAQSALDATPAGKIVVDAVTSALIASQFVVERTAAGLVIATADHESSIAKLGKLVGRKKEVSLLVATLDEAIEESVARGAVVTGVAGLGKTRLRQEIESVIGERGDLARVYIAQADVAGSGSTYAVLGSALRRAAGLRSGDDAATAGARVADLVAHVPADRRARVASFVAELAGAPTTGEADEALRAARGDPALFGAGVRAAFDDLVRADAARGAVAWVIDNVQWADAPSVRLVLSVFGALADQPMFLLALGRPEARSAHPDLFGRRGVTELALEPLTARASRLFVEESLGTSVKASLVSTIVERGGGNPFYLEELVGAARAGAAEKLPDSILGMVQARLSVLSPEARRVLRAASVLGEVLWSGAVEQMLGVSGMTFGASEWLDDLVRKEILVVRGESRFATERELAFRHSSVRDAAYAMLTPEDRARAHRAAAVWLENAGERDPLLLAHHHREAGDTTNAARALRRAAELALDRNDHAAAIAHARGAVEVGADDETRGACLAIVASSAAWAGEHDVAAETGIEAADLVTPGTRSFFDALDSALRGLAARGRAEAFDALLARLFSTPPAPEAASALLDALCHATATAMHTGRADSAALGLARIAALTREHDVDARLSGAAAHVLALDAWADGRLDDSVDQLERAIAQADRARDARGAVQAHATLALLLAERGELVRAEEAAQHAVTRSQEIPVGSFAAHALLSLGLVLARTSDRADEARALLDDAHAELAHADEARLAGWAQAALADLDLSVGDVAGAERRALDAVATLAHVPSLRAWAMAVLSRAQRRADRSRDALASARIAVELQRAAGCPWGDTLPRLALAEALAAVGDSFGARATYAVASDHQRARAARISDPAARSGYLALADVAATLAGATR